MSRLDKVDNEQERTSKRKAFIAFVIDESGSMDLGKDATLRGINEQIQMIKNTFKDSKDVEPIVSLVKFNEKVNSVFVNKGLDELKELTNDDYRPNGATAMYDGVGYMLNILGQTDGIDEEDNSVLVVVVSDGEENSSKEHNSESIAKRVGEYNETKRWTFTYLGANQDLSVVSQKTNMYAGNTRTFNSSSSQGYDTAFHSHNLSFGSYINNVSRGEVQSVSDFYSSLEVGQGGTLNTNNTEVEAEPDTTPNTVV